MKNASVKNTIRTGILALLLLLGVTIPAASQSDRTLMALRGEIGVEPTEGSLLSRPAGLEVTGVTVPEALTLLSTATGVSVAFSPNSLPEEQRVDCHCRDASMAEALDQILFQTEFGYLEMGDQIVIAKRSARETIESLKKLPMQWAAPSVSRPGTLPQNGSAVARVPELQETGVITGRVTETGTGRPLSGVQVAVDGTQRGSLTNEEGRYMIAGVPAGTHRVRAVLLGFREESSSVATRGGETVVVDFALQQTAIGLDEIVVTVTGEQRRREIGNVIGSIRADDVVREAPITRLADLVGARIAGVQILSNTGFVGESPRIRIRGLGSISRARDPLLYVDGVRVEGSTGARAPFGIRSGRFNDLNPNEIESIEVVKGPSAATLYGTDAANGVILVRTKRGQPGRARWDFFFEQGRSAPATSFENANTYYSWGTNTATGQKQRCQLVQMASGVCQQDSLTVFNPLANSETTPIGTGGRSQFGAQVTGGTGELTYFLSGDFEDETGYLRMPDLEVERIRAERGGAELPDWQLRPNTLQRLRLRGNVGAMVGENADVRVSTGLVSSNVRIPGSNVFGYAIWGPGYRDVNDGWWIPQGRPGGDFARKSTEEVTRYSGSLNANWRPLQWLSIRGTVGTDVSSSYYDGLLRAGEGGSAVSLGSRHNGRTNVAHHTLDLGASAKVDLTSQIGARTAVGIQFNRRTELVTIATAMGLPPGSQTVSGAATLSSSEDRVESIIAGAYMEQMVSLRDRLFVTGAMRFDGGSSFGRDFRTAVYPKASLSWLVSEESFFPRVPALGVLRLRAAYGQSGVQPGSSDALDLITRFTPIVHGVSESGARLSRLGNPDLKPERQREFEGGLELDLLDGRVSVEATYYNRLSTDALVESPLAASVGLGSRWENLGSVRNWGYEMTLGLQLVQSPGFSWSADLNGSLNHNRLEALGVPGVTSRITGYIGAYHAEGFPIFGRWGRPILSYHDANGDGIIVASEVVVGDTMIYLGPQHPPRQLTAGTRMSLLDGRLRFYSQFDYRGGHLAGNYAGANQCGYFASCRAVNDPDAPLWEQARAVVNNQLGLGQQGWTGFWEDASFVRWREMAVTYHLPEAVTRHLRASAMSLTLSGRNLHLWTDYTGLDPEANSSPGDANIEGNHDGGTAPQTRYWLLRADVRF